MKRHVESKHVGVKYPCLKCEYAATKVGSLKNHVERKHGEVKYPSSECKYAATVDSD